MLPCSKGDKSKLAADRAKKSMFLKKDLRNPAVRENSGRIYCKSEISKILTMQLCKFILDSLTKLLLYDSSSTFRYGVLYNVLHRNGRICTGKRVLPS